MEPSADNLFDILTMFTLPLEPIRLLASNPLHLNCLILLVILFAHTDHGQRLQQLQKKHQAIISHQRHM